MKLYMICYESARLFLTIGFFYTFIILLPETLINQQGASAYASAYASEPDCQDHIHSVAVCKRASDIASGKEKQYDSHGR